ncbi:hypothetical protein COU78_01045 [Candidatus Peregrinibacteria bacterium CG10_big_fil_rev_8_21_14_0_10_49_24]|nr:MAG: hypothetical protein COV83_01295 [Candidatus Peregrinibacteria bacterium CG11_big_fil_rev_8_21_14_0_20_49_14]PIR51533.1 MAG: hypothetical protein COU78_01045 [Candidatus Peregrinibacteria bacterium CG10_big_fil_rev_8_21_14_0_10_49_24]PJA67823.1 MAG: hypothetical protein CO157_02295 [Candidatus Peregrinibacteria bacterium CG_4_9_14_3_um_filter_49_12]
MTSSHYHSPQIPPKRVRILLVCDTIEGRGGWYTYTRNLRDALAKKGHDVAVCGRKGSLGPYDVLREPLTYMSNPVTAWSSAIKLKRVIHEVRPDVIHITVEPYAMLIPFLRKDIAKKTVLTIHGSYGIRPLERWAQRVLAYHYYKKIGHFITVSRYTKEVVSKALRKRYGALGDAFEHNSTVIKNGIALPKEWNADTKNVAIKNILLVGGVKPRKGVLEALEACAIFKKQNGIPFVFTLVGTADESDPYVQDVRKKIRELHLENDVRIAGPVSQAELESLYGNADLYLMPALTIPNTFEGFGLVYIEANAYGVPCIGPNDSGAREAIAEAESGYRIDPANPIQIAERMTWILKEGRIQRSKCRQWAQEHSIERTVNTIESLYSVLQSAS